MKKIVLIIVFGCLLSGFICIAQNPPPPVAPEMISVSIRQTDSSVVVDWKPSITPGIDGYMVRIFKNLGSPAYYDTVWRTSDPTAVRAIFKYPDVWKHSEKFFVAAYKGYPTDTASSPHGNVEYHQTIFTKLKSDTCNSSVLITWSKYIGWGDSVDHYKIFQKEGGNITVVKDGISPSDTTYVVNVNPNENYCYYVNAIHKINGTITSMSNDACLYTKTAIPPNYIIADYASFNPNSKSPVKLKFSLDNLSQLNKYQLYSSDNATTGFVPVNSPITDTTDSILVQDSEIANSPKYYKLGVLNNCNNTVLMSNVATAMILRATVQSYNVNLAWNEYKGWYNGVQQYNVFRTIGNNPSQPIGNTSSTNFTDDITQLIHQQNSGNICYYIEAASNADSVSKVRQSLSSNYCIDFSSLVFVPTAFTPNSDGLNDEFKPSFAFSPKDYVLIIYNRYGFKVFESTNSSIGWDGIIGKGQKAPEGTYVYFIRFSSQSGETIEKRGNFSLIYP